MPAMNYFLSVYSGPIDCNLRNHWKHLLFQYMTLYLRNNGFHPPTFPTGGACVLSVTEIPRWRIATYCGQYRSWRLSCRAAMYQQVVEKRSLSKGYYSVVANTPTLWTNYVHFLFYFTFNMTPDRTSYRLTMHSILSIVTLLWWSMINLRLVKLHKLKIYA